MTTQLILVESDSVVINMMKASTALAEAVTISQTKKIADVAAAAEIYARRQHLSEEAAQMAATVKVEALRKLGEMLQAAPKAKGRILRGAKQEPRGEEVETLAQLGLTKKESAVAQKIAALPDEAFQQVRDGHISMSKAIAAVDAAKRPAPITVVPEPVAPAPEPEPVPQYEGPSAEELAAAEQEQADEVAALQLLIGADDKLGAALAEVKRQAALIRILEERVRGLQNSNNEHIRLVKSWRAKYEKLAKVSA